ncbi:MAG: O-antigen/teichoic acid export membrane protein [Saprospiraceae bacterium]|jgi:O-antigen/teichoic acid export membrane protein
MTRLVPNLEVIKLYENILLLASIFSFFFVSGLGQTVIPYYEAQELQEKESMFKSLFYLLFTLGLISSLTLASYGFYFHKETTTNYFLFSIITLLNIPCFALENYYLVRKKHLHLLSWGMLTYLLQIPAFIIPLLVFNSLQAGFIGVIGIVTIKFVFTCYSLKVFKFLKGVKKQMFVFLSYSWPVLLSFIIGGSYVYINAIIVEYNLSSKDFVLYRIGAREFPLFLIIANSFSLVYSAKIAKGIKDNDVSLSLKAFKLKSKKIMHQLFPLAFVLMLSSKFLFGLLYSDVYTNAYLVFNIMLFLLVSRLLFPQTILFGHGLTRTFIYASAIELFTGVTLSLALVKDYGLIGVSLAMATAYLIEKVYLILTCYKHKIDFLKHFPTKVYTFYLCLLIGAFLLSTL